MKRTPMVSVIIVSYNTREILRSCLEKLFSAESIYLQVIVVDNASCDGSADMVKQDFPDVELLGSSVNLGFAAGSNLCFNFVHGRYILLLNPDAMLEPDALAKAIHHMESNPAIGIGGGRLLAKDGSAQPSARAFPSLLNEFLTISGMAARFPASRFFGRFDRTWDQSGKAVMVDWVPGAFSLIRASALKQVGIFDERFFLYYEEVDLCRRFHAAGWQIWYWPDVIVRHWGGESSKTLKDMDFSSSGSQLSLWRMRSALLYYRKHHGGLVAWLMAKLETSWHVLRRLKSICSGDSRKQSDSLRLSQLMQQAWRETDGGKVSPPHPW